MHYVEGRGPPAGTPTGGAGTCQPPRLCAWHSRQLCRIVGCGRRHCRRRRREPSLIWKSSLSASRKKALMRRPRRPRPRRGYMALPKRSLAPGRHSEQRLLPVTGGPAGPARGGEGLAPKDFVAVTARCVAKLKKQTLTSPAKQLVLKVTPLRSFMAPRIWYTRRGHRTQLIHGPSRHEPFHTGGIWEHLLASPLKASNDCRSMDPVLALSMSRSPS